MKKIIILILCLFLFTVIKAQITFVDCGNPTLKTYSEKYILKLIKDSQDVDTIELPLSCPFFNWPRKSLI